MWSGRIPANERALTACDCPVIAFGGKAEAAALVDFVDESEADIGAKAEPAALVDFPDELEADFGAKAEPEALGASPLG